MVCKTACSQCSQAGTPILFTRYAVAYSATDKGAAALDTLKPNGKFKTQPGGIALQTAKYNVRMLRAGYLYIRIETVCRRPAWFGYAVHPHGYLTRFDIHHPQEAEGLAACSPQEWGANRSLVWIKGAKDVTKLNYMFHPDPVDPDHLSKVIDGELAKYTQSFDVASWANGVKTGPDTAVPDADASGWSVAEFKALKDEAVRNALEPQLYGLMGGNAMERGWGDYEETRIVETPSSTAMGDYVGQYSTVESFTVKQLDYVGAHEKRLKNIAKYLADNGGAIVACEDAIGIAQELGHLLAEAQTGYTRWQEKDADGAGKGVSNDWVYQTAIAAQNLRGLVKKGAAVRVNKRIAQWDKMLDQRHESEAVFAQGNPEWLARNAETRAIARANQQREREAALAAGDKAYEELFDNAGAANILEAQRIAYEASSTRLSHLGIDHVAWLKAPGFMQAIRRYSAENNAINKPGGGGALTVQISHCMAGTESNSTGQHWIGQIDLFGDNPLGCAISFNNKELKRALQDMFNESLPVSLPTSLPGDESSIAWSEKLVDKVLKPYGARFALGDKAIDFASDPKLKPFCDSALMRKLAWPLHLGSLLSVKMMQSVKNLPTLEAEARIIKFVALTGLVSMGKTAAAYAQTLSKADTDRLRNATRAIEKASHKEGMAMARGGAPHARGAAVAGLFDIANALVKGYQFGAKKDARTGVEMVGSLMQGTGSLLDWRAKAYDVTIFKGVTGEKIFTATSQHAVTDTVQALRLRGMQKTAFRFLLPAAMIGMFWDSTDALASWERRDKKLAIAQWASVAGAAFSITATGMVATGALFGISAATWAAAACVLGLIGAVFALAVVVAIMFLKDEEWVDWLKDIPLNKKRRGQKPVHKNLQETMQKLVNAQASAA
ncbi:T6SS effector BTH_I2691 family protein [Variovorax sp. YR752]|uniref:T6SS effector BTH_I2691 family protein n=1 Tax=Variovorax sp. YR752 TaxID=1884383 RepID=UPI003137E90D